MNENIAQILVRVSKDEKSKWDNFRRPLRWTMATLVRTATNQLIQLSTEEPERTDPTLPDPVLATLYRIEKKLEVGPQKSELPRTPTGGLDSCEPHNQMSTLVNEIANVIRDSKHRKTLARCKTVEELVITLEDLNPDFRLSSSSSEPVTAVDEALSILRKDRIVQQDRRGFLKWNMSKSLAEYVLTN